MSKKEILHFQKLDSRGASKGEYISFLVDAGHNNDEAEELYCEWLGL